jgi:ankyrin repeat protein
MDASDAKGRTALHLCLWKPDPEPFVAALLDMGAGLEVKDNAGSTPLHAAVKKATGHFKNVAAASSDGMGIGRHVNEERAEGEDALVAELEGGYSREGVHLILNYGKVAALVPDSHALMPWLRCLESLVHRGANANAVDATGCSLLMDAVFLRSGWLVEALALRLGVDVSYVDPFGRTAVHIAAHIALPSLMTPLLEALGPKRAREELNRPTNITTSQDIKGLLDANGQNQRDSAGWTPLHELASSPWGSCRTQDPGMYSTLSHSDSVEIEVSNEEGRDTRGSRSGKETDTDSSTREKGRYDDNASDSESEDGSEGSMGLKAMKAAHEELDELSKDLGTYPGVDTLLVMLKAGADIGMKTLRGKTAAGLARQSRISRILTRHSDRLAEYAEKGEIRLLERVLELGMASINHVGYSGWAALHAAVGHGQEHVLEFLLAQPQVSLLCVSITAPRMSLVDVASTMRASAGDDNFSFHMNAYLLGCALPIYSAGNDCGC